MTELLMSRNIVLKSLVLARSVKSDNTGLLACMSWHTERNMFGIPPLGER